MRVARGQVLRDAVQLAAGHGCAMAAITAAALLGLEREWLLLGAAVMQRQCRGPLPTVSFALTALHGMATLPAPELSAALCTGSGKGLFSASLALHAAAMPLAAGLLAGVARRVVVSRAPRRPSSLPA
ncbi:hypothetical protein [Pelomonas sp. KK5]|uniref:hypothetical protein n=1 Tax=Pelomonas sp. KK5 TaxID=1855730 RepID=UPI00117DC3A9|nr:hypothetical protein [Pelomonas sp. KK5]